MNTTDTLAFVVAIGFCFALGSEYGKSFYRYVVPEEVKP